MVWCYLVLEGSENRSLISLSVFCLPLLTPVVTHTPPGADHREGIRARCRMCRAVAGWLHVQSTGSAGRAP